MSTTREQLCLNFRQDIMLLEDVCICNNGILEVFTSRSTASSGNSSNNNTTMISIELIFCATNGSLVI